MSVHNIETIEKGFSALDRSLQKQSLWEYITLPYLVDTDIARITENHVIGIFTFVLKEKQS